MQVLSIWQEKNSIKYRPFSKPLAWMLKGSVKIANSLDNWDRQKDEFKLSRFPKGGGLIVDDENQTIYVTTDTELYNKLTAAIVLN